ncbi:phosphoenolpyruvate hydrolase family protein [Roseovarius sp. 2305UL8-3]|uniref:phosphoenolpyruvate hydrolase family protein n=1 Tax=Roseovarius conchicola TaxID=3121636 RepID=UPI0035281192
MRSNRERFRVGAAVGSGMAAHAAENAGADFILALGAGKLRSMGIPSPASLLPIFDPVEVTLQLASDELVPRVALPVYVGLPLFDPRLNVDALLRRLHALKIVGLTNFPAVFHFGARAAELESHGLGLQREIEFLTAAKADGFDTIGYVRSRTEAVSMVEAGVTSLCINFGLNPSIQEEGVKDEALQQLALAAKGIVDSVRRPQRSLTVYLGGGPVSGGAELEKLCRRAGIDGFIGGSAMDRAPLEKSLLNSVASFREIEVLQDRVEHLERRLNRYSKRYGIICRSGAMDQMLNRVEVAIRDEARLILISGETSTGRRTVAEMVAKRIVSKGKGRRWDIDMTRSKNGLDELLGSASDIRLRRKVGVLELAVAADVITIYGFDGLPREERQTLEKILSAGEYRTGGDTRARHCSATFVLVLSEAKGTLPNALLKENDNQLVEIPPLRDRLEDIPLLAKSFTAEIGADEADLQPDIVRMLIRHNWPGNLAELQKAVTWMMIAKNGNCSEPELVSYLGGGETVTEGKRISQRDRIVQALLLNNLNRTKTAEHLGVTRKTLYNQIKKYNIIT